MSDIIVSSRNVQLGLDAIEKLKNETVEFKQGGKFVHCQLDITDAESRKNAINFVKENYPEGLDILVNNAGFAYKAKDADTVPFSKEAKDTLAINYFATKDFTLEAIAASIVKKFDAKSGSGRILTCASVVSDFYFPKLSENEQKTFKNSKNLSFQEISDIAEEFVSLAKNCDSKDAIMPKYFKGAYGMSKILIRSFVQAASVQFPDYYHASYCPGWCRTDMTVPEAARSAEEGARIAYYLGSSLEDNVLKNSGGFYKHDNELHDWGAVAKF